MALKLSALKNTSADNTETTADIYKQIQKQEKERLRKLIGPPTIEEMQTRFLEEFNAEQRANDRQRIQNLIDAPERQKERKIEIGLEIQRRFEKEKQQSPTDSNETQTTTAPPVQQKEKTSLLNAPAKKDDWFEVINEAVNQFHAKNGVIPTQVQAWNYVITNPPHDIVIEVLRDKGGEKCLKMNDDMLGKSAFKLRLKRYGIK